jgi:tetratricopeptide (TPR) repeat protein
MLFRDGFLRMNFKLRSILPLLVLLLTALPPALGAATPSEESTDPVTLGAHGTYLGVTTIRDLLTGDLEGALCVVEKSGKRLPLVQKKGYGLSDLLAADFGGGMVLVAGWTGGGKGRHLIPEVYRPDGEGKLVKVWGPFDLSPLYEGELEIVGTGRAQKLQLTEALVYHSFVPPHLTRSRTYSWRNGTLESTAESCDEPATVHQKANLAYENFSRGEYKRALRLYLEALKDGDFRDDPELAAALHYAVAAGFDKLGDARQQRVYLKKVTDSYPDTSYARRAADKLLKMKAAEVQRNQP